MDALHLQYMRETFEAQGASVHILLPPYENIRFFDGGLRTQLYVDYDFSELTERLLATSGQTVYVLKDIFNVSYVFLKLPAHAPGAMIMIGPFMLVDYQDVFTEVIENTKLPPMQHKELREYYVGLRRYSISDTPENRILLMAKFLFGQGDFAVDNNSSVLMHSHETYEFRLEPERLLSYEMIDKRYSIEDAMLAAVERGDLKAALYNRNLLSKYRIESRALDGLRNTKTLCITFNTLLRKAAQRGGVHPAYIDSTSVSFARAIESAATDAGLQAVTEDMVQKYCRLVLEHSLRKYSLPVQKVLNYADFHYHEQLSLTLLAEVANTNASYISTQFKKEMGISITDHINRIRIRRSLPFLAATDLSINAVSEKVGFMDFNYYTRVFKKIMEKSPSEYRKFLRQ